MASGFSNGGDFFTTSTGINGGSAARTMQVPYRPHQQQLNGVHLDSSSGFLPPRRNSDLLTKRSLAELQQQQQHYQHQQQQQLAFLQRSVKQRTHNHQQNSLNRTSPISPLSPVDYDFSGGSVSGVYRYGGGGGGGGGGVQGFHQIPLQKPQPTMSSTNHEPCFSNLSFSSNSVHQESENDSGKKMKNQLQELEKQLLLDDDVDEEEEGGDSISVITGSEWSETIQNLLSPNQNQQKPLSSPSPTSSSSSSSSSSSASSQSSKMTLIDAATAISEGATDLALVNLEKLKPISNNRGDPEQRLTAYMVSALHSRINPTENPPPVLELYSNEEIAATQLLYEASPCFKLGFMASNLAILDRFRDQQPQPNNIHILDFEIGQGNQYLTLLHSLAESKTTSIKITAVVLDHLHSSKGNEKGLQIIGDRLQKLADRVRIGSFKFNIVVCGKVSDLKREMLYLDPNESLAVNFSFLLHRLPDESVSTENPRDELLRFVKSLKPCVVTMVEQEMNCNTAQFVNRLSESCGYYRSVFDSLDATMARDSIERFRVEKCLGKKAANSIACEGRDRVERCEVFGKWKARMGMAGFESVKMSQQIGESLRFRLSSVYGNKNPGFTIQEESGGICFGWMGRALTVASAWN